MLGSGTSCSPGDYGFGWNSDPTSTERSVQDSVENSASSSQVWHRDDNPFPSTKSSEREMNQRSGTGRPVGGAQNQLTEVKLDHHNLQVSGTRYIENVFTKVRQKLNRPEGDEMLDQKVNVLMWRLINLCQQ